MCGRFTLTTSPDALARVLELELDEIPELAPRYNIAPTQTTGIVRMDREGSRRWTTARWGLVPFWAKDASIGSRMINARAETIAEKPAYRAAAARRRCLVPATGFFEWKRAPDGKQPYLFRGRDHDPIVLAGLWERWTPRAGDPLETFTIITTRANAMMAEVHDRMPVILEPHLFREWLEPAPLSAERLRAVLVPCVPNLLEAVPVSTTVNNPRNDDARCIQPLT